jgi:RluA family pseudouridine synthase
MLPLHTDISLKNPPLLSVSEAEMLARLLHRDAHFLVINKPPGIAVHIGANATVSIEQFFKYLQFGLPKPPVLAHRLDRETSGCLVLGRHRQATARLGELFKRNQIEKTYLALVHGAPEAEFGVIDRPILKSGQGSRWRITLDDAGQPAITEYKLLARAQNASLLELHPKTGRTHQLRVHCAFALGCPIIGDPFYGPTTGMYTASNTSLMLHAARILIPYTQGKPALDVRAPLPPHILALAEILALPINPDWR